jgi:hypothetical protein
MEETFSFPLGDAELDHQKQNPPGVLAGFVGFHRCRLDGFN